MGRFPLKDLKGRQRIVIEQVWPEIDCGRFSIKRCINDEITVEATIFAEGHDEIGATLKYRHGNNTEWQTVPLISLGNDRWRALFKVTQLGEYFYTISAWIDEFHSWRRNLVRWIESSQAIEIEVLIGIELILNASQRATPEDARRLRSFAQALKNIPQTAFDSELLKLMSRYPDMNSATHLEKHLRIIVDPEIARFSSWYEVFPRSLGKQQHHGSLQDLIQHLPYIADMGFDVLYLPPIHPIGITHRKGKNNDPIAYGTEPGSPWGIGAAAGGHSAIHPQLGSFEDLQMLIVQAREKKLEIALDLALQCSPDHPYVTEHPQWFKHRPDGSIQHAENPPKKYQDIYPINFQSDEWPQIWQEWCKIVEFWIQKGIKIFRVDNPHTKPFLFWEWLITRIKAKYPEIIFLAEAFTRPSIMYYLGKLGFSQSYTYFTWRNTKTELIEYMAELNKASVCEFFRPNFWPNTPDILPEYLQSGGQPAFITRFILAATLSSCYGIYGPAYELCINTPREANSEEYLNSEKYEIKDWDLDQPHNLNSLMGRVNKIRRENISLHDNRSLLFHAIDNDQLIAYSKCSADKKNILLIVVNLDPNQTQSGWLEFPLELLAINMNEAYRMHDLLTDAQYLWRGPRNYIELNPQKLPAHVFRIGILNHE